MADIHQSTKGYDDWLRRQLSRDVVEKDLVHKHEKMRESPFAFLRATYWRWAETIFEICPDTASAPHVLSVGDIHLENFGTWRDADGRLVWGVNDFDEAAEMPYVLDLLRLATSGLVAGRGLDVTSDAICSAILQGYREGLKTPQPVVLDRDRQWLRELVVVSEKKRAKFWKRIEKVETERAPPRYRKVLAAALPEPRLAIRKTARRVAGAGSLGRPRWIGIADWRGAPVVREAKALVMSAWVREHGKGKGKMRCGEIANGRYRAIDPWHHITDSIVVRRLSPNNRKIEADEDPGPLLSPDMLHVMGADLVGVHLGTADCAEAIARDLAHRKRGWLKTHAMKMAKAVEAEHAEWTTKTSAN
ncbi:MAG TPA: DUF2252 family protein [Burkholderiales bacterium]|nr:DUF2252 family protein [Burkholderiales bacterium]